jgi:hypothetical protein
MWRSQLSRHFRKLRFRYPMTKLPEAAAINLATYLDVPTPADRPAATLDKAVAAMKVGSPALAPSKGVREFVATKLPDLEAQNPFCPLICDKFDLDMLEQFPAQSADPVLIANLLDGTQINIPLGGLSAAEVEDVMADLVALAQELQPIAALEGDNLPVEDTIHSAITRSRFPNYSKHQKQARLGDESTEM